MPRVFLVVAALLSAFLPAAAHDHSEHEHEHGDEPAARAAAEAALPSDPEELRKLWEAAHADVHRYLDGQQDGQKDPLLRDVITKFDLDLEKYHEAKLGKTPDDLKALADVIKSAQLARPMIDVGEQAGAVHRELVSASGRERAGLERRRDALGEQMDRMLIHDFPQDFHYRYLMGGDTSITDALLELGLPLKHFLRHGGMGDAKDAGAQAEVGRVLFNSGDMSGAEEAYSAALELNPADAKSLTGRADARYNRGDYKGAFEDAQAALRLEPDNAAAKAVERFAAGRLGVALDVAAPASPWGAEATETGGAGVAAGGLTAVPAAPPSESAAWTRQASAALAMKDFSAASRALDRAIDLDGRNAQALHMRAGVAVATGRYADAVADAKRVLGLSPSSGSLIDRLAGELSRRGRHREAKELTLERLRVDPNDAAAWFNLARAENGMDERDAVIQALRRAAAIDPSYAERRDAAIQAPRGSDLGFLFEDARPSPSGETAPRTGRGKPLLLLVLSTLLGGFLVALGLLRLVNPTAPLRAEAEAAAAAASERPLVGGVYELRRQIGLGGMGIVYEAMDRSLDRRVAVKRMREEIRVDPRERERFLKEARTVASLRHPGIVEIHAIVEEGDDIYLVFEYVDGGTLYELLDRRGRLPLAEAASIVEQAGRAVAYAHGRDVIHRDLKPSNVMLAAGGAVKVMDFGVARQAKDAVSRLSMTQTIVGTPPYMAPEQEQGVVCKESDVYALAVCLYELATGRLPFQGTGAGMLLNKMNKVYAPASTLAPELPAALDELLSRALEPDPARRFRSLDAFLGALRAVGAGAR